MGWGSLSNGVLLARASEQFDVFITVDQNVQFQQNLAGLPLAVIILVAANNRFESLAPFAARLNQLLGKPLARELLRVESSGRVTCLPSRRIKTGRT